MTVPSARRRLALGFLLFLTLAATVWVSQVGESDSRSHVVAAASPDGPRLPSRRIAAPDPVALQLGSLKPRAPTDPIQNAFASRTWVTPLPPIKEAAPMAPTAPALPFTYMGKMQEDNTGSITVYLMQGEQAYSVKKGEVIDQLYRVESITAEHIVLTYLPMSIKQTLALGSS